MGYGHKINAAAQSGIQIGPRKGKFYINSQGHKVYGIPPHIYVGASVKSDLAGEGWVSGKVAAIDTTKGTARVVLSDGSGHIESPFEATRPHHDNPPIRRPTKDIPLYHKVGSKVEVDLEGEGWTKGVVEKTGKGHLIVRLHDGTLSKAYHESVRPVSEKTNLSQSNPAKVDTAPQPHRPTSAKFNLKDAARYVSSYDSSLNHHVDRAIELGNFGPLLKKYPLNSLNIKDAVFSNAVFTEGTEVKGNYNAHRGTLNLSGRFADTLYSTRDVVKSGPKLHDVAGTVGESWMTKTAVHELSHHMHLNVDAKGDDTLPFSHNSDIVNHFSRVISGARWAPSSYSMTNYREWFAEAHTAYVFDKDTFRRNDPEGFSIVKKVRDFYGMGE